MKNRSLLVFASAAIAALAVSAPAASKPNNPNAAETASGEGCLVRDATGAYHFDATCKYHMVVKRNKDGSLKFFSYQDKGQLPDGAPAPASADKVTHPWPGCGADITEMTTPSGQYSSECRYGKD
jgi:hypothetical protein